MAMKKHEGDISTLFNYATKTAATKDESLNSSDRIIYIRVSDIEKHPDNPLDEREIDDLASQIVANGYHIETVEVRKLDNGKYRLISGHRRTAAKRLLLERGEITDDTIPCIIRTFDPPAGSNLSADDMEIIALISANRGQRKGRTLEERLREAKLLEPIARKVYDAEYAKGNLKKVSFRRFFAKAALEESESTLQRLRSLDKLTDNAKAAVMAGVISETAAAQLASLSPAKQDAYVLKLRYQGAEGGDELPEEEPEEGFGTVKHVTQYVQQEREAEENENNDDNDFNEPDSEPDSEPETDGDEKPEPKPKKEEKPKPKAEKKPSDPEPTDVVNYVQNEAEDWVSSQLEEYHRKMDKICYMNLVDLATKEMEKAKKPEARSQWDLRRAAAQLAYDREVQQEES